MFDNDGHFIDDPLGIVNAKPDFEGIGEFIPVERNCIVIDGVCYVLREPDFSEKSMCGQCDLAHICEVMGEWPICEKIHNVTVDDEWKRKKVYKKKEHGKDL